MGAFGVGHGSFRCWTWELSVLDMGAFGVGHGSLIVQPIDGPSSSQSAYLKAPRSSFHVVLGPGGRSDQSAAPGLPRRSLKHGARGWEFSGSPLG